MPKESSPPRAKSLETSNVIDRSVLRNSIKVIIKSLQIDNSNKTNFSKKGSGKPLSLPHPLSLQTQTLKYRRFEICSGTAQFHRSMKDH